MGGIDWPAELRGGHTVGSLTESGGEVPLSRPKWPWLGRLLDGIAGSILLGFGLLLLAGNLGQELSGSPYPAIPEAEAGGLLAVVLGFGALLLWLALRRPRGGG
jgi:hypothetical protein